MIIKSAKDEIQQYLFDQANLKGACDKVFIVENPQEIAQLLKEANELQIPVTVCGNHTSLNGSSLPEHGWVITTERLNRLLEINTDDKYAIVEPGITLKMLQEQLKEVGLFFPPDPTEDSCFIGGMIGTNASGARSFKYGATRNSVEGLEIILPTGDSVAVNRDKRIENGQFLLSTAEGKELQFEIPNDFELPKVKNAAGYYLSPGMYPIDLFIGAEGTLGVVTKAKLKLLQLPKENISLVVFFNSLEQGFSFLDQLRARSKENNLKNDTLISARSIEFFDDQSLIMLSTKFRDIPAHAACAFWIDQACDTDQYDELFDQWAFFLEEQNVNLEDIWLGADERDKMKIISMRHELPILVNDLIKQRGVKKLGTDVAVPDHLFADFYQQVIQQVKENGLIYVAFGHFGDSHLHLNIIPVNLTQMALAKQVYDKICMDAINLGGTFSAEHGVGKTKRFFLKAMLGNFKLNFMRDIKHIFDPKNILGRGNLFDNI